ncbi:hypothetical protein ES705_35019 [subsurface metagenome]
MKKIDISFFKAIRETPEYCQKNYGLPVVDGPFFKTYKKNGFLFFIDFFDNKAVALTFRKIKINKTGISRKLSDNEIHTILKANGGEINWILFCDDRLKKIWYTSDKKLTACYSKVINTFFLDLHKKGSTS